MRKSKLFIGLVVAVFVCVIVLYGWTQDYLTLSLKDDFGTGSSSGGWGQLGWEVGGSLCSSVGSFIGSWPHLGILRIIPSGGNTCAVALGNSVSPLLGNMSLHPGWSALYVVRLESLANAKYRIGFADTTTGNPPLNGIWFRYDSATDTYLTMETRASGVSSTKVSTLIPSTDKFMKLWIMSVSSGEVRFTFDGIELSQPYTLKANVPTVSLMPMVQGYDNGIIQFDYFRFSHRVAR